jgi:hypothetical protein
MPWERRWVPPEPPPGAPPWLPLAPVGGYWTDVYVPTPDEREAASRSAGAAAQREVERAKDAEAASAQLEEASRLTDVRGVVATHDPELFSEAASLHAWRIVVASGAVPPTHDLVHWKARHREFEFWFRGLPDSVVREQSREPLWLVEDQVWATAAGLKYRLVQNPEEREWPFRWSQTTTRPIALPHGARFAPTPRRFSAHARPEYCLPTGEPVEVRGTNPAYVHVDGRDLVSCLPSH